MASIRCWKNYLLKFHLLWFDFAWRGNRDLILWWHNWPGNRSWSLMNEQVTCQLPCRVHFQMVFFLANPRPWSSHKWFSVICPLCKKIINSVSSLSTSLHVLLISISGAQGSPDTVVDHCVHLMNITGHGLPSRHCAWLLECKDE